MVLTAVLLRVFAPAPGESAVVGEVGLLVVIPPSPRFALPGLDAGVVGQSVTRVPPRFAPPGRHGPGAEAGGATPVGACRGPVAAVRAGPDPSSRPRVTAAPAITVRTPTAPGRASEREPHRNRHHARGRTRTPAPPNPRDRRVTREHVT